MRTAPRTPFEDLEQRIAASTQGTVAKELGIAQNVLCDVMKGRRRLSDKVAERLGWTREWVKK